MNPYWLALCPQDAQHVAARDAKTSLSGAAAWADPLAALAWWGLQFTPWVAQVQQALVLEISASERLFGDDGRFPGLPTRRAAS